MGVPPADPPTVTPDTARPPVRALYPHQQEACDAAVTGLPPNGRGQVLHACGSGKTTTAAAITAALGSRSTLVLLPSLALIAQTVREWALGGISRPFDQLVVCSDDTVSTDDYVQRPSELDLDVTTDPTVIAGFLDAPGDRDRVVFSTYQSSSRVGEAQRLVATTGPAHRFSLAICDEAHRLAGDPERDYAAVLDDALIAADRRLFFTATPRLTASSGSGGQIGMDNEDVFGPVLHRYTFARAISEGRLVDYQVLVLAYTADRLTDLTADTQALPHAAGALRTLAASVATGMSIGEYGLRRLISFHGTVAGGRAFAAGLPAVVASLPDGPRPAGPVTAAHINGQMPMSERRSRMTLLETDGPPAVISNARCLTEGVDVPALDGVVIADPRGSRTDLVQIVGRALRTSPGKTIGTVVVPVVLRQGESAEAALAGSAFEQVWQVVAALRDHDEDLAHELDTARRAVRLNDRAAVPTISRMVLSLPDGYTEHFAAAVRLRLVERTSTSWADGLAELAGWVVAHGHAGVPQETRSPSGFALGGWLSARRKDVRAGRLTGSRQATLTALGVVFDPQEQQFQAGLRELVAWRDSGGPADVPARHVTGSGFRLGAWVSARRRDLRAGRLSAVHHETINRVGLVWDPLTERSQAALAEVIAYKKAHAGQDPPQSWVGPSGRPTGLWLHTRRCKRRAGTLPAGQEAALRAAGVSWDPFAAAFDRGLASTAVWFDRHGTRPAVRTVEPEGFPVGGWLAKQRAAARAGTLGSSRAAALTAVCPDWDAVA